METIYGQCALILLVTGVL